MPGEPTSDHRKPCTLCSSPRDVLVRCQIDDSGKWHFVCPGSCWTQVSGGVVDGDKSAQHQHYRYGGMWKNKHEAVSAKKPKPKKPSSGTTVSSQALPGWIGEGTKYVKNDRVSFNNVAWICRKSHVSQDVRPPSQAYSLWKEDASSSKEIGA